MTTDKDSGKRDTSTPQEPKAQAPELDRMQRWFFEMVSHPKGVKAAFNDDSAAQYLPPEVDQLKQIIKPSKFLSAARRMDIYADMYFWRLVEVLESDFEVLSHCLGHHAFHRVMERYLQAHPSRSYTLSELGRRLPEYIREADDEDLSSPQFLSEIAALELAISDVFAERRAEPLAAEALGKIPQDAWVDAVFTVIPAFRLLSFEYPSNVYFQAYRDERAGEGADDWPEAEPSWLVVFRKVYTVWRMDLSQEQYVLLEALSQGKTLGESIELCAGLEGLDLETLTQNLMHWFQEWTADGLFSEIHIKERGTQGLDSASHAESSSAAELQQQSS